jgi:HAD superfamily hydrolase (TIGR01549 family)
MTKLVVFDAFGTLVKIHDKVSPNPFKMVLGKTFVCNPMSMDVTLDDVVELLKHEAVGNPDRHEEAKIALEREVSSVKPFPEAIEVMQRLASMDIKIVICSNLAKPYADPLVEHFGEYVDFYAFSFETYIKPDLRVYKIIETYFRNEGIFREDIFMVGDSYVNDYYIPLNIMKWKAALLDRTGSNTHQHITNLTQIFDIIG